MPRWSLLLVLCLLVVGCKSNPPSPVDIKEVLSQPGRLPADVERDARSRPDLILPLLALEPGDRVADIFAGGGYYSELLGHLVSPGGAVILHNNALYKQFVGTGLKERFHDREVPAVTELVSEAADLQLGDSTLDAIIMVMSYHDLYFVDPASGWTRIDAPAFLRQLRTALKPGGRLLIVDHAARPGTGNQDAQTLHRIEVGYAISDITQYGFCLLEQSEVLENPEDDHTQSVFDPGIRGQTDRFVLLFRAGGSCT